MSDYHGYPLRTLKHGSIELDYLSTAGPRIVGLRFNGSENLLAGVPQISLPTPWGDYHYIGGHRLWYAPEGMPRSYVPDGDGLDVEEIAGGVILQGKQEPGTGICKRVEITFHPEKPQLTLKHTLVNAGLWDVELAPWAITMFRLGGVAVLPFQATQVNMDDLLPNRRISLWPYSKINDPRLRFEDDFILISAKFGLPLFKIGAFNPRGWLAYWNSGVLFRKTFDVQPDAVHPDYGRNAEIYCDEHFIELESLSPLGRLGVGASVSHTETWDLYDAPGQDFLSEKVIGLMQLLVP